MVAMFGAQFDRFAGDSQVCGQLLIACGRQFVMSGSRGAPGRGDT